MCNFEAQMSEILPAIAPEQGAPSRGWEDRLRRLLELLLLLAVAASALVYPWRLPNELLGWVEEWSARAGALGTIYQRQLRGQFAFSHSPLIYKESVAQAILVAALCVFLLLRLIHVMSPNRRFGDDTAMPVWRRLISRPEIWVVALLVYFGSSALFLSPTFHYSFRTFMEFSLGVLFFYSWAEIRPNRETVRRLMAVLCACGAVVASVALLQHLEVAGWFMPKWSPEMVRNRMGSFIGHNTGVSSWLLFPLSFALYLGLFARRRWGRWSARALAVLIVFVTIAAQSRAIWLVVVVGLPPYLWILIRASGFRMRTPVVLTIVAIVLAAIALQTIAPRYNPFARNQMSLGERVREDILNPQQLVHETRLRILAASLSLVAESPAIGTGFGTFQWVYPPAQGEYFIKHPNSALGTTQKRTDLAHDEYLQLLVETGIIGCILFAVPVIMYFRRGWRVLRSKLPREDLAMLCALLFPICAVAAQAFVDFPMHVVPTALAEAACFALFCSSSVIFSGESVPISEAPNADEAPAEPVIRWRKVAALAFAGILMLGSPYAYQLILREFISDIYYTDGNSWLTTAREQANVPDSPMAGFAGAAREQFRKAIRLNLFNGAAYEGLTYAESLQGGDQFRRYLASPQGSKQREAYRIGAQKDFEAAVNASLTQLAAGELRYHTTYYLIGQAYHMLWRIQPSVSNYLESAKRALRMAMETNTADVTSMFELSNILEEQPAPDVAGAQRLRRRILEEDPEFAYRQYLMPQMQAAERGHFTEAENQLRKIEALGSQDWRIGLTRAFYELYRATWPPPELDGDTTRPEQIKWRKEHLDRCTGIMKSIAREAGQDARFKHTQMRLASAEGDFGRALKLADALYAKYSFDKELTVLRLEIAKHAGQRRASAAGFEDDPEVWRTAARVIEFFINTREGADGCYAISEHTWLDVPAGLRAAAFFRATGEKAKEAAVVSNLKKYSASDPDVRALAQP